MKYLDSLLMQHKNLTKYCTIKPFYTRRWKWFNALPNMTTTLKKLFLVSPKRKSYIWLVHVDKLFESLRFYCWE